MPPAISCDLRTCGAGSQRTRPAGVAAALTGNGLVLEPTAMRMVQRWNLSRIP